jgi:hypothetical protein
MKVDCLTFVFPTSELNILVIRGKFTLFSLCILESGKIVRQGHVSKLKVAYIISKNSFRTAKKTPHSTIRKINWLMLFKTVIAAYT